MKFNNAKKTKKPQAFNYYIRSIYFHDIGGGEEGLCFNLLYQFLFFFTSAISGPLYLIFSFRKKVTMCFFLRQFFFFLLSYSLLLSSAGRGKKARTTHLP